MITMGKHKNANYNALLKTGHGTLLKALDLELCNRQDIGSVEPRALYTYRNGAAMVGTWVVDYDPVRVPGAQAILGVEQDIDSRRRARLTVGLQWPKTGWGYVRCEVILPHQELTVYGVVHKRDLTAIVRAGVRTWCRQASKLERDIDAMGGKRVGQAAADAIFIAAGRAGVVPWARLGLADAAYTAAVGIGRPPVALALYRTLALMVRRNPPHRQPQQLAKLRGIMWKVLWSRIDAEVRGKQPQGEE